MTSLLSMEDVSSNRLRVSTMLSIGNKLKNWLKQANQVQVAVSLDVLRVPGRSTLSKV